MKGLERRLRRQARSRARASLADVLLGTRPWAYAWHRLSLPAGRALLIGLLQLIEAALLLAWLDEIFLLPILTLRVLGSLVSSSTWGITEALRVEIRALRKGRSPHRLKQRFELALGRSVVGAVALVLLTLLYTVLRPHFAFASWSVVDAVAVAIALRVGLGLIGRTLQSGPGATRRVYRPRWSLIVPELLDAGGLIFFWWLLGPWSVAVAIVVAGLLQTSVASFYAWRAMIDDPIRPSRLRLALPDLPLLGRALAFGTVGLTLALPSGLILGLLGQVQHLSVVFVLYGLRPLADLVSSTPRLYLIDILRTTPMGPGPRRTLERHLGWTGMAALGFLLLWVWIGWVTSPPHTPWLPMVAFAGYAGVAGLFSATMIPPLLGGRVGALTLGAVLAAAPVLVVGLWPEPDLVVAVVATSAGSVAGAVWLRRFAEAIPGRPHPEGPVPLVDLLYDLRGSPGGLALVQIRAPLGARQARRLSRALSTLPDWKTARVGRRHLLVAGPAQTMDYPTLIGALSGVGQVRLREIGGDRAAILRRWTSEPALPEALVEALSVPVLPRSALRLKVRQISAEARWRPGWGRVRARPLGAMRALRRAVAQGRGERPPAKSELKEIDLAVLHGPTGVEAVLVIPKRVDPLLRSELRSLLWRQSVARAAGGSGGLGRSVGRAVVDDDVEGGERPDLDLDRTEPPHAIE
ncbi:MAG: hypothetical protein EA397_15805 [Deltaproteobacteria bacterium]|nr:MAG: hypothetical protein EA397_15805 [Deltaproteobacteria bacterium]